MTDPVAAVAPTLPLNCGADDAVTQPTRADETLMLQFAAGDLGAFEALYNRHRLGLFRFLLRSVNDSGRAEELFQDVWMKIVDARDRYHPSARFQTYLYRIARNRVIDFYRANRRNESLDVDQRIERIGDPNGQAPEQRLDQERISGRFRRAIADLPLEQRTAFLLQAERGMSLEEIAQISGVGRETVKSRLRYANEKLREALREQAS